MGRVRVKRLIRIEGDIAYVPLTRGLEAVIDAADAPMVEGSHWHAHVGGHGHAYASRSGKDGEPSTVLMHRHIAGPLKGDKVDHKDGDGLNNRRANLRVCTHQQNMQNRAMDRRNKHGFKGVSAARGRGFAASIQHNGRTIHLGQYDTPELAGAAYAGAAKALFGDFVRRK